MTPCALLAALGALVPELQSHAPGLDDTESFPEQDLQSLRKLGVLTAALPTEQGGLGYGSDPDRAEDLFTLLRTLGRGNLAIGRLIEAHVNALQLIGLFGSPATQNRAAQDARDGHLFALWVTDQPGAPLTLDAGRLHGGKAPCSGAGHASRALVTVQTPSGITMAVLTTEHATVEPMRGLLPGMRSSTNGRVRFDGLPLAPDALIGGPGDYLAEPHLSTGAWRTSAVTLGGLDALVDATRDQLVRKGHHDALLQQDRFGRMLIAQETARLWTLSAARRTQTQHGAVLDRVAYVNLARIAVETACLDAMRLSQRALGLGAFIRPNPVERLLRDLAVYLRQPAPDAVLTEAANYALRQ